MKNPTMSDYISLGELYLAYRKAKVEAYYENTHFHAVAFTEYEQDLDRNLENLYKILVSGDSTWMQDLDFIGSYAYLPKSIDSSKWDEASEGHFRALNPLTDWEQRFADSGTRAQAKLRLIIRPTVNYQIVSALWIIKVGHKFDRAINSSVSYGNRLRRSYDPETYTRTINLTAVGLFEPYFSAYRNWREKGLSAMEESLKKRKDILAITMDIEQFYHRISPSFLLNKDFLRSIDIKLSKQDHLFTRVLLESIDAWYQSTPDYIDRREGAVPVGLSASKIIANVLLANFDNDVVDKIDPIYYGRYVDDIFLVFENLEGLTSAKKVTEEIAKKLSPSLVVRKQNSDAPSLELKLKYAPDSKLIFVGKKQKIFALSSEHGLDLIQHIRENIRVQSSEYRLLPALPKTGIRMASKALLATPEANLQVDALRKADVVSVRRLGVSLLLRDLEAYSMDLAPKSWLEVRKEFYNLVERHVLTPVGFFDFFGYLPRVFGLMLACRDVDAAQELINYFVKVSKIIEKTTTLGEPQQLSKYRSCISQYAQAFLQFGLQAGTEVNLTVDYPYFKTLKLISNLDPSVRVPKSLPKLAKLVREILLADWGRRPYKDYWYLSQKVDEIGPPVPTALEVRRVIRVGGIRRFRKESKNLKRPHWPALAFPTRPLRIDEIGLVAPNLLTDPSLFKSSIMVLRGARVATTAPIGIVNNIDESSAPINFFVPGDRKKVIRVAITSFKTTEEQWKKAALGLPDRTLNRYENLNDIVNQMITRNERPDYLIFPELSIPLSWVLRVARKLATNGISLLAGVEYRRDSITNAIRNDCLVSLVTKWPGYQSNIVRLQPKFYPAHGEQKSLNKLFGGKAKFFKPTGTDLYPTLYIHNGFCFSILICSDLTDITHRHVLRGKVDALFALEWNADTKTFSSLVEATANDLHAYVAQINNRLYGDSRLRAPRVEDFLRDIVQVKGGTHDYFVLGDIDYLNLRKEQNLTMSKGKGERQFKPVPIGYTVSTYRKMKI